jgi:hypothetical protein
MEVLQNYVNEYRKQMEKGTIQKAYRGIMEFILELRTHFKNKYPDYIVSGNIYYGYLDMTYFSFFPQSLKERNLKIAIVFLHDTIRFEVWLAGYNKEVQTQYWQMFKKGNWNKYPLAQSVKGVDYIINHTLLDNPDFDDPLALTQQIEKETLKFINDIEEFLSK